MAQMQWEMIDRLKHYFITYLTKFDHELRVKQRVRFDNSGVMDGKDYKETISLVKFRVFSGNG